MYTSFLVLPERQDNQPLSLRRRVGGRGERESGEGGAEKEGGDGQGERQREEK